MGRVFHGVQNCLTPTSPRQILKIPVHPVYAESVLPLKLIKNAVARPPRAADGKQNQLA
jgi:hypothetical protein